MRFPAHFALRKSALRSIPVMLRIALAALSLLLVTGTPPAAASPLPTHARDPVIARPQAGLLDTPELAGTVQREAALGGVLITLADPTRDMLREAASHGYASTGLGQFRKIMVKTIAELMAGVHDDAERLPPIGRGEGFRAAPRERSSRPSQAGLFE